jgi:hypothetical protein
MLAVKPIQFLGQFVPAKAFVNIPVILKIWGAGEFL